MIEVCLLITVSKFWNLFLIPDGAGVPQTVFKGSQRPYQKECVLIIDRVTGEITLEKLSCNIQVKKTRSELKQDIAAQWAELTAFAARQSSVISIVCDHISVACHPWTFDTSNSAL